MINELVLQIWGFFSKFRWSLSPSKLEGHMRSFWEIFFLWNNQHVHLILSKSIGSSCAQPSLCPKGDIRFSKKTPTRIVHNMWKILVPKFGSYIWAAHKTTSQNKQCQTNKKILHAWSMRSLYVILANIVVDTTLHQ